MTLSRPHHSRLQAEGALIVVALFWGTTFVVVKDAVVPSGPVPPYWFVALRFGMATAIMAAAAAATRTRAGSEPFPWRAGLKAGAILGFLYFLGYITQTLGLQTTSATKSAFITESLVLWTPLMTLALMRRRPKLQTLIAVPVGFVGLFLLIFKGGFKGLLDGEWVRGDALTLLCAVAFAAHIVATKRLSHRFPTTSLVAIQLAVITALSGAGSILAGETRGVGYPAGAWATIAFCAVFPTAVATWAQTRMQQFTTEERTAIIFLFEPVFAAIAGYIVLGERLDGFQWAGAALILGAALAPEIAALREAARGRRG